MKRRESAYKKKGKEDILLEEILAEMANVIACVLIIEIIIRLVFTFVTCSIDKFIELILNNFFRYSIHKLIMSSAEALADEFERGESEVSLGGGGKRSKAEQAEHKHPHPEGDTRRIGIFF